MTPLDLHVVKGHLPFVSATFSSFADFARATCTTTRGTTNFHHLQPPAHRPSRSTSCTFFALRHHSGGLSGRLGIQSLAYRNLEQNKATFFLSLDWCMSAPSCAAPSSSQLSEDPYRTFDVHVSIRCFQLVSMVFHRKPKHPVEKIPTVIPLSVQLRIQPQPVLQHQ